MRSMNTRGRQVSERLAWAEDHRSFLENEREFVDWFEEGLGIQTALKAAMHGEVDPATLPERPIRDWQAVGREVQHTVDRAFARWAAEPGKEASPNRTPSRRLSEASTDPPTNESVGLRSSTQP